METTPLEALVVKPDEVLVLKLPSNISNETMRTVTDEILVFAEAAGLGDRVGIIGGDIEVIIMQTENKWVATAARRKSK
jgi:hypothetical protein